MHLRLTVFLWALLILGVWSCNGNSSEKTKAVIYKGVYSFGPKPGRLRIVITEASFG